MSRKTPGPPTARVETAFLLVLFLVSGFAALVYEVLWLKELGRLFGVTAHAAATTMAVFFLGLALGGWAWGRRAARLPRPLRTYGWLELAIAASAVLYFVLLDLYRAAYPTLFEVLGPRPALLLLAKLTLAVGILLPPAFFMGGTLPIMGQHMIRHARELGLKASLLYGVNTLGAALGALAAGFVLPIALGFRGAYLVAIGLNVAIGLAALALDRRSGAPEAAWAPAAGPAPGPVEARGLLPRPGLVRVAAFSSGFLALALEVLWVRMYAQVLQNSVYTFAAILAVFLLALALGSALAHALCRRPWPPWTVLFSLLTLSGFLVGLTPWTFHRVTSGLGYLGGEAGWPGYVAAVFGQVAVVILVPGVVVGSVFPYLMKLSEPWAAGAGRTMGQLGALNTGAAIAGSLLAGFVLLEALGLWRSVALLALLYLLLAMAVLLWGEGRRLGLLAAPAAGVAVLALGAAGPGLAVVQLDAARGEEVLFLREGSEGTVAVVRESGGHLRMKLNNSYALGGSQSALLHRRQAWIPLSLHENPRSAFFLGLGTGLSVGGALDVPLKRVVVCELSPGIVEGARRHFAPHLNGLFQDPRVTVLAEDGRTWLFATREGFDVIVADLFQPWKAGVGSLYSREHFETVRSRLNPGGVFAQWLPLAQVTRRELGTIARTLLDVFPGVTLWRRGYSFDTPAVALVARLEDRPLDGVAFARHLHEIAARGRRRDLAWLDEIPLAAYAGNLTAARALFDEYPVNTDDRPVIEYLAPVDHRSVAAGRATALTGDALVALFEDVFAAEPPRGDPHLVALGPRGIDQVEAGLVLQRHLLAQRAGRAGDARRLLDEFRRLSGASDPAPR